MDKPTGEIDIVKADTLLGDFDLPKIQTLKGETYYIDSITYDMSQFGEYAVVTLIDGRRYQCTADILVKQLHRFDEALQANKVIEAGIFETKTAKGSYFTFVKPKPKKEKDSK